VSFVLAVEEPKAVLEKKLPVYKAAMAETLGVAEERVLLKLVKAKAARRRLSADDAVEIAVQIAAVDDAGAKQAEAAVEKPAFVGELVKELAKKGEVVPAEKVAAAAPEICGGKNEQPCKADDSCLAGFDNVAATSSALDSKKAKITTCKATYNQHGYHCTESFDGKSDSNSNGWAFWGLAPVDAVWTFDADTEVNRMDILSGIKRIDHRVNNFDIY
jgi:hypothetical protein